MAGDVVVLVDGYYHHSASVRHKEILALLDEDVSVFGCASMGALRAAELHRYGMIGNGVVFEMYRDGVVDADDEVAVAHTPAPEYRKLTIPLVGIRYAVESAKSASVLSEAEGSEIVAIARSCHYTERSWRSIRSAADRSPGSSNRALTKLQAFMEGQPESADVKSSDTLDTLRVVAAGKGKKSSGHRNLVMNSEWRNHFLTEWETQFSVTKVNGVEVGRRDTLRYLQIYHDGFPSRWRRFVLAQVTELADSDGHDLFRSALAAAARHGLTPGSLTERQAARWLTTAEMAQLPADEALIRVLVRSYDPLYQSHDLAQAEAGLLADPQVLRAVAESHVINAEVASWAGGQSADNLKPEVLRDHLAQVWQVEGVEGRAVPALLAAARDRGFRSVEDAVDAVRMFFLRSRFRPVGTGRSAVVTS
ncbi:MAG TPA: TfuA domain-containing protein [Amycolatopsis sp.]|uniref:TfuA domain-containing protein n=1 Tax=Amycolatopsis sp. TaxID=37632 RepID=UPI002B487C15|nr:TfuA domain-containing protein [Amycolatopsis sp.]HKS46405.1 TfuA domain-containing protein [Amycolatopsis sp.]